MTYSIFQKSSQNQLYIQKYPCNIVEVLREVHFTQKKNVKLNPDTSLILKVPDRKSLNGMAVETDSLRLRQILNNLINNSIKFTDSGTIEFGFTLENHLSKDYVRFYVKDTGIGIPEEKLEMIFDRFIQAKKMDIFRGMGLSLKYLQRAGPFTWR